MGSASNVMGAEQNFFWLVGLLEGEGSFMCPPPSRPNEPRVEIEMTDQDTMLRVAALVGLKLQTRRREGKTIYRVRLAGRRAVQLMVDLRAFLCSRRQGQIARALAQYSLPTGVETVEALGPFVFHHLCDHPMCPELVMPVHRHGFSDGPTLVVETSRHAHGTGVPDALPMAA